MRVDNAGVNGPGANYYTRVDSGSNKGVRNTGSGSGTQTDRTSLTATDELVGLAKTLVPSGRTAQMSAVSAALNNGNYNAEPGAISQALVNEHIEL